jgi:peroxiredoxin Q/BCP
MPPELRKRKAPAGEPAAAPPAKKKGPVAKAVAKVKEAVAPKTKKTAPAKTNGATAESTKIAVGETIDLEGFGGEIETNDGVKTTLKALVDESKGGVVLFTYPKASTPGCEYSSFCCLNYHIFVQSSVLSEDYASMSCFNGLCNLPYHFMLVLA